MSEDNKEYVSKSDLQVMMAAFEQKVSDMQLSHKKELELQSNQINSSYAKKLKKLGLDEKEDDGDETTRKPTKRELEMQSNIEKLVKEVEDAKTRTKQAEQRQTVQDKLLKGGINPKAAETLYTLFQARQDLVEDESGALKLKVNVEGGVNVALPIEDALKHFLKSEEGQLFQAPINPAGTGAKQPSAVKEPAVKDQSYKQVNVDWDTVAKDMKFGDL